MAVRERVAAAATSGQSHLIVAVLLLSFVIWVTLRGNLGKYLTFLGFGAPAPTPQQQATGAAGGLLGPGIPGGLQNLPIPSLPNLSTLPGGGMIWN